MFIFKLTNFEIVKPRPVGKTIRTKRNSDSFRQLGAIIGLKIKAVCKRRSRQNKTQRRQDEIQNNEDKIRQFQAFGVII